ncbi:MAG TPA: 50S ribosomal protein L3 [Candidatus Kapabacteria bacterium]|jgi:large subunit ribosomal protein L3|nr:50S ribosomal protein L3 [Candidatus Kapabacteria bacterium]HRK58082.1 50S ribosomal protein L3 [Candidatus Kapabacteria bacterium]
MSVILGKKLGMTSVFNEKGDLVPCTVVEAGPCPIVKVKTKDSDGYDALQIGYGDSRTDKISKPVAGQFTKAGVTPKRLLKEFRNIQGAYAVGDAITVSAFTKGDTVKAVGTSKGKGFQGVVRRHHFSGVGMQTHGQADRQRAPGSIGASSYPSRVFKGQRMAGRMGGKKTTVRNLKIVDIMPDSNLILVSGSIPGAINSVVELIKM